MADAILVLVAAVLILLGTGYFAVAFRKALQYQRKLKRQRAAREVLSGEDDLTAYLQQVDEARTTADLDRLRNERNHP